MRLGRPPGKGSTPRANAYRKAIAQLGLNQVQAGVFLDVTQRTSRNYASGGAPLVVEMLLRVMIHYGLSVDDVNQLIKRKGK